MDRPYRDRFDAGRRLSRELTGLAGRDDVRVLALPRGGVPVAFEIARALAAPLDVFLVRKLGVPGREELALGAIASGGVVRLNDDVIAALEIPSEVVTRVEAAERVELQRRERAYRGGRAGPDVAGRVVVLVDDGLATGASMRAAVAAVRQLRPKQLVVAVPVAARSVCDALASEVARVVCPLTPDPFRAVGLWYDDFSQTTDAEVRDLLARAEAERVASP